MKRGQNLPFELMPKEQLKQTIARAKQQIRKKNKALRGGFSANSLQERSQKIVARLLTHPALAAASSVALFWPMTDRGEVDLRPLDSALRAQKKRIYYPFMNQVEPGRFSTGFALTHSSAELVPSAQGFLQPQSTEGACQGDVDLVMVPALAADTSGHRIGYGAGFYDATLNDVCPPAQAIIVAYQFQMMAELPHEDHDRPCDWIVTDTQTYRAVRLC